MKILKYLSFFIFFSIIKNSYAMDQLSDNELSNINGQSLLSLSYIADNQNNNPNKAISFYRMGMEVDIELNANIKRLQLGCGGSKGQGCDIDIENLSLVGVNPIDGSYAGTDAKINNPFIEFAIKNANSSSTREIVGFRLGALELLGKLGLGSNENLKTMDDDIGGIHSLSGDLNINLSNINLHNINIKGPLGLLTAVKTMATIDNYSKSLILNRDSKVTLTDIEAQTGGFSLLGVTPDLYKNGISLKNLILKDYPTSAFHEILLSQDDKGVKPTSDVSLSFQTLPIKWEKISTGSFNNSVSAQQGWWLSLPNVVVANVSTEQKIDINILNVAANIFTLPLTINPIDSGQRGVNNCYGSLKFC